MHTLLSFSPLLKRHGQNGEIYNEIFGFNTPLMFHVFQNHVLEIILARQITVGHRNPGFGNLT